jgi:2-oxoglutarate ferredoxin oxidoreductase subunit alpha
MADFVPLGFELAFKYNILTVILADGLIGQMMEKVVLPPFQPRRTEEEIRKECPWASLGKTEDRARNVITSLELQPEPMERRNIALQEKYATIAENEVRFEEIEAADADYLFVAFGSAARICQKAVEIARAQGIKVGLLRPITLFPFPTKRIQESLSHVKGILSVEYNAGQMIEDIRLAVEGKVPVEHFGRMGGIVPTPDEVVDALKSKIIK